MKNKTVKNEYFNYSSQSDLSGSEKFFGSNLLRILTPMANFISRDFFPISFFFGLMILVLWQMLLPGYLLTLDMIFTPKIKILFGQGFFYNTLPIKYFLSFLNLFFEGWIIQKIVLMLLFFLIGYLCYKFLPLPKDKKSSAYWAGLFFLVNPFVYTRFLAGHYMNLFAYAVLPVFIFYLINFFRKGKSKDAFFLIFSVFLISIFSLHYLVMVLIIFIFYGLFQVIKNIFKKDFNLAKRIFLKLSFGLVLIAILSSYWTLPYLLSGEESILADFSQQDLEEFKTVPAKNFTTSFNVLLLYGFWGEQRPWANYFLWPADNFIFWAVISVMLFSILIFGLYQSLKSKSRQTAVFFIFIALFSFIFSSGIGQTIFRGFNQWLFDNVWFWSGFRDSQKWSAFLVLSCVYFGSFGVAAIINLIRKIIPANPKHLLILMSLIPAIYTYTMWGGFSRQLKPVWYPESWHKVNQILNEDKDDFNVLFLPWHQYLSLKFNQNIVTMNPAQEFFDKNIIQGENIEIGDIFSSSSRKINSEVENILLQHSQRPYQDSIRLLSEYKIKYIIFSHDLDQVSSGDAFMPYNSDYSIKIFSSEDLTLYKIL